MNKRPLPTIEERNAFELLELVTRFISSVAILGDGALTQAALWLREEQKHHYLDDKGAHYVYDAAITALTWQVDSDLNGAPLDPNEVRRTPKAELETLRVSLARIAQVVGAENNLVPVLSSAFRDYGELVSLARTQERGWNALAAAILGKLESQKALAEYDARRARAREELEKTEARK